KNTPSCLTVMWYGDFTLNCSSVVVVAIFDLCAIMRIQCINVKHTDNASVQRRSRQRNLVYQVALQGIFFISELITYFLL
ncbi:hypothetical protein PFISCL1PPCAC_5580, partial [Pristionchus fissidentatus]